MNTYFMNLDIPSLIRLATAIMYVLGMYIVISSIISMKDLSKDDGPNLFGLIKQIVIGSSLLYFPSTILTLTNTLFSDTNVESPLSYVKDTIDLYQPLYTFVFQVCMLVGVITVGRALYHLGYGKEDQEGNTPFYKGFVMLIAGTGLINLQLFVDVIMNTLGL